MSAVSSNPKDPHADALSDLVERIKSDHTNRGEACEMCAHRFPYDDCVACGQSWPCDALRGAAEIERLLAEADRYLPQPETHDEALRYIASPSVGFPGTIGSPDYEEFVMTSATETNVRAALATCIRMARAALKQT